MKMSKKYKALLLAGVLTALGGSAFATDSVQAGQLWNYDGLNGDGIVSDWNLTIGGDYGTGVIGRNDGKSLTFKGGSINSTSIQVFAVENGTLNFGIEDNPLTSFAATSKVDTTPIYNAGYVAGSNSEVNINTGTYNQTWSTDGIYVGDGGKLNVKANTFTSDTKGVGISVETGGKLNVEAGTFTSTSTDVGLVVLSGSDGANPSKATIKANEVNITSTGSAAVLVENKTDEATAPAGASSVSITADKINLKGKGYGVIAFSNGQVTIDGDTTIDAKNALDVRGNSTTNINTSGEHSTVINGDIVFETPNKPGASAGSGKIIDATVNLNLSGKNSSWTGSAYHEYGDVTHGVDLSDNDSYYGDVTGLSVAISDGASWNMTESSFVNNATVSDNGRITVQGGVSTFNADTVTLSGGKFTANGGTSTINTLNAGTSTTGTDSTITVSNSKLIMKSGEADLLNVTVSGRNSMFEVGSDAKVDTTYVNMGDSSTLKLDEEAKVSVGTLNAGGTATVSLAADSELEATKISLKGNSSLDVESGATVSAVEGITAEDAATVTLASGSTVNANMYWNSSATTVKALGNLSGTFYKYSVNEWKAMETAEIQSLLSIDNDNPVYSQLTNNNHTVQMDVSEDGTFSIRSYDLSGTSTKIQQLGTWSAEGDYTAYGD